jgi:hypothetical protein
MRSSAESVTARPSTHKTGRTRDVLCSVSNFAGIKTPGMGRSTGLRAGTSGADRSRARPPSRTLHHRSRVQHPRLHLRAERNGLRQGLPESPGLGKKTDHLRTLRLKVLDYERYSRSTALRSGRDDKLKAVLPLRCCGLGRAHRRSLHCAPPDFLWNLVALLHFMRPSLRKGAYAALSSPA